MVLSFALRAFRVMGKPSRDRLHLLRPVVKQRGVLQS